MTTYYHLRRSPRTPGTIINPTMRSILEKYVHHATQNPWRLLAEYALEERRLALAPDNTINRMDSNFVFLNEEDAMKQLTKMSNSKVLFEVELVEPDAQTFMADFELVSKIFTPDGAPFQQKVRDIAKTYWAGVIVGTPELLTTSPLRVIRTVRTFP